MSRTFYFISHPNVVISQDVAVPRWPLSPLGRERMRAGLQQPWINQITAIYSSTEQKAIDAAEILARHLSLPFHRVEALGENDRSATGFLSPQEFEQVADAFFAQPINSVRGWERGQDAQSRIVGAVTEIHASDRTSGTIAIVSHGAVGTLLHCHLNGQPISRKWDQPANGGGNFYRFTVEPPGVSGSWAPIDSV